VEISCREPRVVLLVRLLALFRNWNEERREGIWDGWVDRRWG